MKTQTEISVPKGPSYKNAVNTALAGGVTIVLERCEVPVKLGVRRFVQLRAYNSKKEVRMRVEDNVTPHNFKIYLDLVCREIARIRQDYPTIPPLSGRRQPHSMREFVRTMAGMGMFS